MDKTKEALPELRCYLKKIEPICKDFPVCCQESSLILYMWLKKNGIDCKIIGGDREDPVLGYDSFHFWVETEELIVDGTAVQFLLPDYSGCREYQEIQELIPKTSFVFKKEDTRYKNKIDAYIDESLDKFLESIINKTSNTFDEFMDEVRDMFMLNKYKIAEANKVTMYSSLCKNNMMYYGLNFEQFLNKCYEYGITWAGLYIVQY